MTKDKIIEDVLIIAQKYNDFIDAESLAFTKYDIGALSMSLSIRTKAQIRNVAEKVLNTFNHLKLTINQQKYGNR